VGDLGRMNLRELVRAYLTYPTILLYMALIVAALGAALWLGAAQRPWASLATAALTFALYPFVEYLLHRFVLHGRWLYKSPLTAALWKRIHFDHHQDPQRLDVLFGAPSNTLPTLALFTLPLGYGVNDWSGAMLAFACGAAAYSAFEFCHCVQHLNYIPSNRWLARIKKHHMAHHFHNEAGNFGLTSTVVDRLFGSHYEDVRTRPRSSHVGDLGYDEAEARRYPWVRARSAGLGRPLSGRSVSRAP
jgi:sterol desaturase/sphingolipid hydroxylase (fatty acid hydroxylase superfamily)